MSPDTTGKGDARPLGARSSARKKDRRTPLGRRVFLLARGKGQAPAAQTLAWLEQSGTEDVQTLVAQLKEAMVQRAVHKRRDAHGNVVKAALAPAPIRHLEDPHARMVLAVWLCIAEMTRNHMANSRALWLENIGARLGVCRWTVGRALDALNASGALKSWRPPQDANGVVKGLQHGRAYNVYLVRVVPRELVRQVHIFYASQKRRTSAPMTEAPAQPTEAEAAALARVGVKPAHPPAQATQRGSSVEPGAGPLAAAYDASRALARFAPFLPAAPPIEA